MQKSCWVREAESANEWKDGIEGVVNGEEGGGGLVSWILSRVRGECWGCRCGWRRDVDVGVREGGVLLGMVGAKVREKISEERPTYKLQSRVTKVEGLKGQSQGTRVTAKG